MPSHDRAPCTAGDALAAVPSDVPVRLAWVDLAVTERLRLAELGIRAGALVTVLARTAGGGRVLGIGTSRVALDRATAARLRVETP